MPQSSTVNAAVAESVPLQAAAPAMAAAPIPVAPNPVAAPAAAVAPTPSDLVAEPPKSVAASLSRKRRKRSSNAALTIGIPVLCFVAFVSVMAAIFWNSQPELKGTISGAILPSFDLPVSKLSLGNLQLDVSESDAIAAEFDQNPERFLSAMMKCSIGAEGRQLTVKVVPGEGYEWFTVNPSSNANLMDWAKKNSEAWDMKRKTTMQQVAADLCKDKLKRAAGERVVINAARYRDEFALATQVKGFGYLVEAIGQSQRAVCAHEDSNGTLYFSLPKDTQSFVLQGRSFDKQPPVFPGSYTVKISQAAKSNLEDSSTQPPETNSPSSLNPDVDEQESSDDKAFWDNEDEPSTNNNNGSMSGSMPGGTTPSGGMSDDKMSDEPMMMKQ